MSDPLVEPVDLVAGLMFGVGSLHFVIPAFMEKQLPRRIPAKRAVILASGVVEVACAAGLATRRPWAPGTAAAVLLAIWPANIQMALDAGSGVNTGLSDDPVAMWARVPLQIPLIWAAWSGRKRVR